LEWSAIRVISPGKSATPVKVETYSGSVRSRRKDVVAVEEPLEIRIEDRADGAPRTTTLSVTMRTPGDDFSLVAGFLHGEGLLRARSEISDISYCMGDEPQQYNIVVVRLKPGAAFDPQALNRNFYMTSSCGVCGKASLEAIEIQGCERLADGDWALTPELLAGLPDALRERQGLFDRTGGIHAAGLFSDRGELIELREDVGRHNAVDKVVGYAFLAGQLPLTRSILAVSGRVSFEILQKALAARIAVVVAVGAPSSLAVDVARRFNITLLGFARGDRFNVYSGGQRLLGAE
jgi:FdhD protein